MKKSLKDYLVFLEEVKKETTENSAKNLTFSASAKISGQGLTLWHPNGAIIRKPLRTLER